MPGGRRTHNYPHGTPTPLVLVQVAAGFVGIAWLALFSWGWVYRVLIASAFLALCVVHSKLNKSFERSGLAVRIPRTVGVSYPNGVPTLLRWLQMGAFAGIVAMLLFGLAPMPPELAHRGIIACVLSLFLLVGIRFFAVIYFVNTGRAKDEYDVAEK